MNNKRNNKGWAKFWREQWDNWVSDDKPYCRGYAWTYLWSNANHKSKEVLVNNGVQIVKRGELLTSIAKLAKIWQWSDKKVSNFLNTLEKSGMIKQKRTSKFTLIRIENYGKFQSTDEKRNIRRISGEHQGNTNKNAKKGYKNPLTTI